MKCKNLVILCRYQQRPATQWRKPLRQSSMTMASSKRAGGTTGSLVGGEVIYLVQW